MTETRGKSHKEEEIRSTFNDQNICSADKDTSLAIHQYHPENLLHKYCSERKLTIYKIHEILTGHQQKKKRKKKKRQTPRSLSQGDLAAGNKYDAKTLFYKGLRYPYLLN